MSRIVAKAPDLTQPPATLALCTSRVPWRSRFVVSSAFGAREGAGGGRVERRAGEAHCQSMEAPSE